MGVYYEEPGEFEYEISQIEVPEQLKNSIDDNNKQTDAEEDLPEYVRDILGERYELD